MKKVISFVLTLIMIFAVMAPAVSVSAAENVPMIYIRGNGEIIVDANGNEITTGLENIGADEDGEDAITKEDIVETCVNILLPFLTEGLIWDEWDNYGKAIYDELSPLFEEGHLDGDGNAQYGTGVSKSRLASSEYAATRNYMSGGRHSFSAYSFCYDWRLSPYDHVDRLHTYVQTVMKSTGAKQVSLTARCFGGGLLMAYLEKYGHLGHVKNAVFSDVLSNGCAVISNAFSGNAAFDSDSLERYLCQLEQCGELDVGQGFVLTELVSEIIYKTMDLFNQVGVVDSIVDTVDSLYARLYKALMPAICKASGMATQANYWTCVYDDEFDQAVDIIFGEKGSEAYTAYEGLIEKINYYREHVTSKLPGNTEEGEKNIFEIFTDDYKIHIGFIGKYGYLNAPFVAEFEKPSDALVSLEDASFGATCAPVGKTFSEDYINARIAEGKGKYISPDKQVDTSTCFSPDTTWIIKNCHHDFSNLCEKIAMDFCFGTNVTVESSSTPRFTVYDEKTKTWAEMTEDNCADYEWIHKPVEEPTTESRLVSFMRWLTMLFNIITMLLKGEITFGEAGEML